jgi:thioredoxin reductase (NADPH)
VVQAKTVILALGAQARRLGIPGEKEWTGKGVSYCATCDGAFFGGQEVVVVGGGDTALQEALFLTRFAAKVTLIHRRDAFRGTRILQEKVAAHPKISLLLSHVLEEIRGENQVSEIQVRDLKTKTSRTIRMDGVFVFVGLIPNSSPLKDLIELDQDGFVLTGPDLSANIPGIFAAGDLRSKTLRQISTAVGEGAQAAYSAEQYLENWKD